MDFYLHRPGPYRRAVSFSIEQGIARAALEDDLHSFAITIRHDGATIESVESDNIRTPFNTCPSAAIATARLAGTPLVSPAAFDDPDDRFRSCTHTLDIVNLAAAHALEPGLRRLYRIEIEEIDGLLHASIERDGAAMFAWQVQGDTIVAGPWTGQSVQRLAKAIGDEDADTREAAMLLRRACHIGQARNFDTDKVERAGTSGSIASCHTLQFNVRPHSRRNVGTYVDFSGEGRWPLT
ncbi:DUF2889 domain-containing protein [Sphingomonas montanisoli]|uniref:DUF2889 domain-containing protein n=1 Tax=Sphingomonas montanisoli TaxID=2606412 RepID=A0A5D9C9U3_9SPHN|nr:DUF2889 domain-containing protein [Sphingomonas montanisoli]TZG27922.1 DUF2889 domain-containing protein [Sphingomonas montanisoli]